jgi:hypothetical protein
MGDRASESGSVPGLSEFHRFVHPGFFFTSCRSSKQRCVWASAKNRGVWEAAKSNHPAIQPTDPATAGKQGAAFLLLAAPFF